MNKPESQTPQIQEMIYSCSQEEKIKIEHCYQEIRKLEKEFGPCAVLAIALRGSELADESPED